MHETKLRVRYSETDQMGVVYHANYLVWMEVGRVELVRSMGVNYHDMEQRDGLLLTVVEARCRYISPAKYDQEVAIVTRIEEINSRMIEFAYSMEDSHSRRILARGLTKHMWLNREFKPTKLPHHYLEMLQLPVS